MTISEALPQVLLQIPRYKREKKYTIQFNLASTANLTTKVYCVLLHVILLKGKVNPFRRNGYGIRSMEDWIKQKGWGLCLISTFNYMPVQNAILLLAPFYLALFFFFHFEPHFTVFYLFIRQIQGVSTYVTVVSV